MRLFLFGSGRLEIDDREIGLQRRRTKALLAFLAVTRARHQRQTLAALLWPDSDQSQAHAALRRHLSDLNRALGPTVLDADRETVGLHDPAVLWLDIEQFQQHLDQRQDHAHAPAAVCPECIPPLTEAVALYRADFLAGFSLPDCPAFDEWQFFQADSLHQRCATALDQLVQAHRATVDAPAAIPHAQRRLRLDPLHEPAYRQLMRLYLETDQRAAALRQYQLCVQTLAEELGGAPAEETTVLYDQIRRRGPSRTDRERPASSSAAPDIPHNLPAATTPFIGRQAELTDLEALLDDPAIRLITILGPGGMGKTRLALEAAHHQLKNYGDGVYVVSLAPIQATEHIVPLMAETIGFQFLADGRPPPRQLADFLRSKEILVVLDNFEHLLEGVDLLQNLLQTCPILRLLVTSRERLHLSGETVFPLDSMDFPSWETPEQAFEYSALQLFVQAAQRARPGFKPEAEDVQHVARICRLVGGMPLGIILAAARIPLLAPADIAAELTQGFDLLETPLRDVPDRQRNMRTVLAYSWKRLAEAERDSFMRLSLFQGGFTRQAAEVVAGASLDQLTHLADKAIVQRVSLQRYEVHELLRQYGREQLRATDQEQAARTAHSTFYLNFVHEQASALAGREQSTALAELTADFENIRTAWHRAVQRRDYAGIDRALEGLFRWFWLVRSRQHEGQALLRYALEQWAPAPDQEPSPLWLRLGARIMDQEGPWLTEPAETKARIERALNSALRAGDRAEIAFCSWALGLAIVSEKHDVDLVDGLRPELCRYEQSLEYYRTSGDLFYVAQVLENMGYCYRNIGQMDRAISLLEESLETRRLVGDRFGVARSVRELGFTAYFSGHAGETERAWQEAWAIQRELGDPQGIADSLHLSSALYLTMGDWQKGRELSEQFLTVALDMNSSYYQRGALRQLEIAASMERTAPGKGLCTEPNTVTPFSSRLFGFLLSFGSSLVGGHRGILHRILAVRATTDAEKAVCLPFAAHILAHEGDQYKAAVLLGLACRYPHVADGWIGHLPEIVELRQQLIAYLSPADFHRAWEQGQAMDMQTAVEEVLHFFTTQIE